MQNIISLFKFAFINFGPLIVFYVTNHFFGLEPAVMASIVWSVADIIFHLVKKKPISLFFKFSAAITILFGVVDLYLQESFLFKYEAALSNVLIGLFFAVSLFGKRPIIREFAEAQGRIGKDLSPDGEYYFKFLTLVWSLYSFIKAAFYIWVATHYELEQGLAIRVVVGNASFYALLALSIFGKTPITFGLMKLKMMPSSKVKVDPARV